MDGIGKSFGTENGLGLSSISDLGLNLPSPTDPEKLKKNQEFENQYPVYSGLRGVLDRMMRGGGLTPGRDNAQIAADINNYIQGGFTEEQMNVLAQRNPRAAPLFQQAITEGRQRKQMNDIFASRFQDPQNPDIRGAASDLLKIGKYDVALKLLTDARGEETGFEKDLKAAGYKPGSPEWIREMHKHIQKLDAPTAVMAQDFMGSAIPQQDANKTGEEYLNTLPPNQRSIVKGLSEGRMQWPSGFALRTPYWNAMLQRVAQYDPSFDASNYQQRLSVRKDFTSGTTSRNITALNTGIGHLGTLYELGEALKTGNVQTVNSLQQRISTETGQAGVNNFNLARNAVANELTRIFRQVGASEKETEEWASTIKSANSPEQMQGAIKTVVDLLKSRINALNDQWKRGMNTDKDFQGILSEKSQSVLNKLSGKTKEGTEKTKEGSIKFLGFE